MAREHPPTILHVVHALEGGGTERTLVSLLNAFDASRYLHRVVTLRGAGTLATALPSHVSVRAFESEGRSWTGGVALGAYARKQGVALIHARNTCCWPDALAATFLSRGVRLVLGFHGLDSAAPFDRKRKSCARWAWRAGASFTTVGTMGRQQLHREAAIPNHRIKVLRNGIDLARYQPTSTSSRDNLRSSLSLGPDDIVFGTVGSLTEVKDHDTLLRATRLAGTSTQRIRVLIVGDGPLRKQLERQVDDQTLRSLVRFTGGREDIPELLGCVDAYVCSSSSECLSNAMLEAMATGLPIITTNVGDHAAIVRDGVEGLVVTPHDPLAMSRCMESLAMSTRTRRRMALATRLRAREFDFNRTVLAYEDYYADTLKRP